MGKQKNFKKNNSGRLLAGPPKIRKPKKTKKTWENQKKNNSQRLLAGPPFPQDFPRIFLFGFFWFFCFPKVFLVFWVFWFWGVQARVSQNCFCVFCVVSRFFGLASELTSHLKASVLFAYVWNRLSSTLPSSLSKSPYTSLSALTADWYQCGCHLHFQTAWHAVARTLCPLHETVGNLCERNSVLIAQAFTSYSGELLILILIPV